MKNWYIVQSHSSFENKVAGLIKEEAQKANVSDKIEEIVFCKFTFCHTTLILTTPDHTLNHHLNSNKIKCALQVITIYMDGPFGHVLQEWI